MGNNNIVILVKDSEAYLALVEEIKAEIRNAVREAKSGDNVEEWVNIEEAKKILGFTSKKKWKQLRDRAEIDFAKIGKPFVYSRKSLLDYIGRDLPS
jgi:hypothetical protein